MSPTHKSPLPLCVPRISRIGGLRSSYLAPHELRRMGKQGRIRQYPCSDTVMVGGAGRSARARFCRTPAGHEGPHEHVMPHELQRERA